MATTLRYFVAAATTAALLVTPVTVADANGAEHPAVVTSAAPGNL